MNAQQLKNSILQEAIEGRLVPQDPNDEPASVLLDKIRKEKAKLVKEKNIKADKNESYIYHSEDGHWMEHFADNKREDVCIDSEIPFDIPKGWEWCRFSSLYWLLTDGTHSTPKYTLDGVPFLSVKDMSSGKLSFENTKYISPEEHANLSQRCHPQKGDLLLSKVGTTGIPLIIDTDKEFSIFVSLALIKFFPNLLDSNYLLLLINSPLVQAQVKEETRGIGNKNWVLAAISNTLMVLPPLAEQQRIAAKVKELHPKVEEYGKAQESLDKLNEDLPERLKKSILQEAIEGRLVPQDPNDEPASVLLDKIRKEKAKLVKEGKLKRKDLEEFPVPDDEIPFEIPESWEWCRIGSIFNHSSGKQLSGSNTEGLLREYITTSNLYWGRFELDNLKSMYYKDSELEKCTAKKGDLLVCEGGDIGRSAIWPYDYEICLQNHVHRLRPYDNRYTVFVFYIMWIYKSIGLIGGKGIGIQGLSASALKSIAIPLPPLAEQKRIVEKIEQLLHEIEKLKV